MRFRVACELGVFHAVNAAVAVAADQAADWSAPWLEWVAGALRATDKAERLAIYRAERDRLLAAGELAQTRTQLLRQAAAAHLAEKGWRQRRWKQIPDGEFGRGRHWGSPSRQFEATMTVDLDDKDGDLIRRVAYWTSASAVRGLRKWTDLHGRGPAHIADLPPAAQGPALVAMVMNMPLARHLRAREELRAQIVTVGDILRDVAQRAAHRTCTVPTSTPPLL